jgi:hypothetical protein
MVREWPGISNDKYEQLLRKQLSVKGAFLMIIFVSQESQRCFTTETLFHIGHEVGNYLFLD